ncbi:MAG: protocatechuate 3,4-dioxygenase subunit alpha [Hyphomicrobiaceae bacterium]|nr:protocatechuate 3,4-dioxygenase subunit alpha [Hyphomicrobiaceae bacterium]
MTLKQTPSQTAGPFFHYMLTPEQSGYDYKSLAGTRVADETVPGHRIRISGTVVDGLGQPLADALVELWQADAQGRYAHPADGRSSNATFTGFGRCAADDKGVYAFDTVKPGAIGDGQAPHVTLIVFARGGQNHLYTRLYFEDEVAANATDPVLQSVPEDRRATLVARKEAGGYRLDIRLQGDDETVFFDV